MRAIVVMTLAYLVVLAVASFVLHVALYSLAAVPILLAAWAAGRREAVSVWLIITLAHGAVNYWVIPFGASPHLTFMVGSAVLLTLGFGIGLLRDRTDAQIRRQRLIEARYERAARGANDVLWEWETESGSAYFSAQWPELLGCATSELAPRITEWFDRVHPEDLPGLKIQIDRHRAGETLRFEHEHRIKRKDGMLLWVLARGVASVRGELGPPRVTGWITDITEQKRSEAQLRRLAFHDALTGLPNRSLFLDRLHQAHQRALRRNTKYAVLLADLDRFKVVNDSLGHSAGDLLLIKVARLLRDTLRSTDTIARLGGDEFIMLLEDLERPELAEEIAAEVLGSLCQPLEIEGHRMVVGASIGVSAGGGDRDSSPEDIIREADIAMYQAKNLGGSRVELFDPTSHANVKERLDLENELRKALDGETLHVHYQPIVDLDLGTVVGFEALARWHHPVLGVVSPGKFIPVAEEAGLIEQLGECVLRLACREAVELRNQFPSAPAWRMGVNLSVAQLARTDLCARIEAILQETTLPPDYLSLEITESGLLEDTETASRTFAALQARGVRLAMDDFGTGYSSLQYLRRFRVDTLKIDGSFVRDLDHSAGEEICAAIITLGRDLGLSVIAEGVERPEELRRLRRLGGRYAQGFLLSKPLPAHELSAWLADKPGWRMQIAS
jgi:diguanylate cyclase (GGDEF)-like protein/PAS domain S-box-containing protein